jgi:hypothetical protein
LQQTLYCDEAADEQLQFIGFMECRLEAEGGGVWVDADGKMIQDDGARILRDGKDAFFVRLGGQHVQIGDQEKTFVLILEGEAMAEAAHKVA